MKILLSFVAAMAAGFGCSAQAATFIQFNGTTGVFGNTQVDAPTFSDIIDLGALASGAFKISGTISSSFQNGAESLQNIDFTSVSLNGTPFTVGTTGQYEFRYVGNVMSGASNLFSISGTAGNNASYSGTINVAAVPEPSTWVMLLTGFGAIAFVMRGRRGSRRTAKNHTVGFG